MAPSPVDDFLGVRPSARWRARLQWIGAALALCVLIVLVGRFVNGGEVTRYATAPVERDDLRAALIGTGTLQPTGQRSVAAGLSGVVLELHARPGERVTAGQLLARLDPASMQAEVARAEGLISAREGALAKASAAERELREQLARFDRVRRDSNNMAPSDREMGLARNALRRASRDVSDAQVELDAARTALAEQQARLASAEVRAPAAGLVVRRLVAVGQAVTTPDQPLFELADPPTRLRVEVMVEQAAAQALRVGAAAQVRTGDDKGPVLPATVAQVRASRTADAAAQAIVALDVRSPGETAQPGQMATAQIGLGVRKDALVVPEAALRFARASDAQSGEQGEAIYILGEQGAPRRVAVRIEGSDGRRYAVASPGLQAGAPVIVGLR